MVEWADTLDDPLMAQVQSTFAARSTGLSPTSAQMPSSPPWVAAPGPGNTLQSQAGFSDIGSAPNPGY
jgi:hypothetical protein